MKKQIRVQKTGDIAGDHLVFPETRFKSGNFPVFQNGWDRVFQEEFQKDYYLGLCGFLENEYAAYAVYPDAANIYSAFAHTDFKDVKAVILGQDPYCGEGMSHGLAFSVEEGKKVPPSLRNIYKELAEDLGVPAPESGNLVRWAKSGVLLLNSVLTVRAGESGSHRKKGWERLTDSVITALNAREEPIVFLLWGQYAKEKAPLISGGQHFILTASHPSPLSARAGFFGCRHFSKCNGFLRKEGIGEIEW